MDLHNAVMLQQSIYHTWHRYKTLRSHVVTALPIVILMPHSSCNCRCVMCDIWKGNKNTKQLTEKDVEGLLASLNKLGTKQILFSGGEALLNPNFFKLCAILKKGQRKITLLSTGLTVKKNVEQLLRWVDDIIVSLDGPEEVHDKIRNIEGAFSKLKEGVQAIKQKNPDFSISGRTVIHQLNFRHWPRMVDAAKKIGLDSISFLPADVSSHAFNREVLWNIERQHEVMIEKEDLPLLETVTENLIAQHNDDFKSHYILESPEKLRKIPAYYKALHGLNDFPAKKCNAPWVSAVVEADGSVRPCFFHTAFGNIHQTGFAEIINGEPMLTFRKELNMDCNETCKRCVCYLNLPPRINPAKN